MNFFPKVYKKPELMSIVDASELGWGATCEQGGTPGGGSMCSYGGTAGTSLPVCLGTGGSPSNKGDIYYRSSTQERLFNTDDMNEGL